MDGTQRQRCSSNEEKKKRVNYIARVEEAGGRSNTDQSYVLDMGVERGSGTRVQALEMDSLERDVRLDTVGSSSEVSRDVLFLYQFVSVSYVHAREVSH